MSRLQQEKIERTMMNDTSHGLRRFLEYSSAMSISQTAKILVQVLADVYSTLHKEMNNNDDHDDDDEDDVFLAGLNSEKLNCKTTNS